MIIQWVIIAIFILIGLVLLQLEHHTRKYKVIAIILIGFLIYFSIIALVNSNTMDLSSPKGIVNAVYFYFGWIGQTSAKLWDIGVDTTSLVGNAIKINSTSEVKQKK
jgi:exosortase/archaeosortase